MSAPPTYSTIEIEEVEFDDDNGILNPFPGTPLGGPHPGVDPQGLVNPAAPPMGDDAYVLAVHAVDPLVGPDPPKPSGNPATSLSTIIGLRALEPGPEYTEIEVPIFETPQLKNFGLNLSAETTADTFPPNPDGDTDIAVTLWYNINPGDGFGFKPSPILSGGQPIVAEATITDLDQNESVSPITGGGTGPEEITSPASGSTDFGSALDSGSPVVAGEPGVNSDQGRAWILPDSGGSVTQGSKLTASQPGDRVGETVAVDGNTAVVGAPGAAKIHVYKRSGGSWPSTPTTTINAPNPGPFGLNVGIEGDALVTLGVAYGPSGSVGIIVYERGSSGSWDQVNQFVDLGQLGDIATDGRIALIVDRSFNDVWVLTIPSGKTGPGPELAGFFGPDSDDPDGYGKTADVVTSTGALGSTIFVGADNEVFVYTASASGGFSHPPGTTLTPSSGATGKGFGTASLAAEGNAVAVGAPTEGTGGITYLYEKTGGSWGQTRRITAPSGASDFGRALALSSSTLYVGASTSGGGSVYTYPV